ncbi:MAG TPA: hypothetical protein VIS96_11480 [Terrimicrobiaceae bacterium]
MDLLQLLGERVDLLHAVVDPPDRLCDVLDMRDFEEHVRNWICDDKLLAHPRRGDQCLMPDTGRKSGLSPVDSRMSLVVLGAPAMIVVMHFTV